MSKTFYIADLHFGHKNIIRYDNRPFATIEEMDNTLIKNWNKVVSNDDFVYILGDISWHDDDKTAQIFKQLHGTKILIRGNHDSHDHRFIEKFDRVYNYLETVDGDRRVVLCHYPIPCFKNISTAGITCMVMYIILLNIT